MRLNRLELTRYGLFTDHVIDFGPAPESGRAPDLHIIYGPNEAGKSTTFAAFLDLLYGIGQRSPYDFLHPYSTMRIGAEIEFADGARRFARLKKNRDGLLDGHERPIPDTAILAELGGIDRDAYGTMFSLDDATLTQGGESILASGGELGQLLFSASAGLAGLADGLNALRAEAEAFHKPRGRNTALAGLKTRLDERRAERDRLDTAAAEYARLVAERDRAVALHDREAAERTEIRARLSVLRRHAAALPRLNALRGLEAELAAMAHIPDAPADWADALPVLRDAAIELATRAEGLDDEIRTLTEKSAGIVVDERILALGPRIALLEDPRARHLGAEKDLPERRAALRGTEMAIAGILARLGRPADVDPRSLLSSPAVVGTLRELIRTRSGIAAAREAAAEELVAARRLVDEAERASRTRAPGSESGAGELTPAIADRLERALSRARDDDHGPRLRLAERARGAADATLATQLAALRPWTGPAAALRDMTVPDAGEIAAWKSALEMAERRREAQAGEIARLTGERRRVTAELEAIGRAAGVVTDAQAAETRHRRDAAWAAHRDALTPETADRFAETMREDDRVTEGRIANAAEVARLRQGEAALARLAADLETATAEATRIDEALERVRGEIATAIAAIASSTGSTLPGDWRPERLGAWLDARGRALEALCAVETADRDAAAAERDGERVLAELRGAALAATLPVSAAATAETLIATIRDAIEREADLRKAREAVVARRREAEGRERAAATAVERDRAWLSEWATACAKAGFDDTGEPPTVAVVEETLRVLEELAPLLDRRDGLADRIAKMTEDQARFAALVGDLARETGMDADAPPRELEARITQALAEAHRTREAREAAEARLREARERAAEIATRREIHDRRIAEMLGHFGVGDLLTVERRLRELDRRRELAERAEATRREIRDAMAVPSLDEALRALGAPDCAPEYDAVAAEIDGLESRLAPLEARVGELYAEMRRASDRLEAVGGDDAVARIEAERRTILLEIEEGAARHLRIRLGIAATERALEIYRDRHRGSMMARASDAFRVISRGAYAKLTTQPGDTGDKGREILVAVSADGGSRKVGDLSKGTRFQLYLALRVAGYHEFARSRPPVPFVADDIMESFDDFRAEEAFRLLGEMAGVGQVIYLTHHRHLCDIARTACPGARVHELRPGA